MSAIREIPNWFSHSLTSVSFPSSSVGGHARGMTDKERGKLEPRTARPLSDVAPHVVLSTTLNTSTLLIFISMTTFHRLG